MKINLVLVRHTSGVGVDQDLAGAGYQEVRSRGVWAAVDRETIVVCGATGNQGRAVVQGLLNGQNWKVIALSRNSGSDRARALEKNGVEVVKADLQDKASLIQAFEQAHGVFGVTQPWSSDYRKCDPEAEVEQGRNIVEACKQAGVKHLVFSTALHSGRAKTGIPHVDSKLIIEEYVLKSGIPYTFLQPTFFMENIGADYFPVRKGLVKGFVDGDAKVPYVSCVDIGIVAALAFEHPDEYLGKEIKLIGDFVSGLELCQLLGKLRQGEQFKYKTIPRLLMRIFAKEFYLMRVAFEKWGRPPYPKEIEETMANCRRLHPEMLSVERYLESRGYAVKSL